MREYGDDSLHFVYLEAQALAKKKFSFSLFHYAIKP